jgi:2-keto-myo-inositol isomerase
MFELRFALNHMAAPRRRFAQLAGLARRLGIEDVEIRNDLPGIELQDGTPAGALRSEAAGLNILSINALQRFTTWDEQRQEEAEELAAYAASPDISHRVGASGL